MRNRAQIVIVGAGIVGCSVAYHLARLGATDVLVIDQGSLFDTGGSSSHAPGGVFQVNLAQVMTRLASYTVKLYGSLRPESGPAWYDVGGLEIAWTPERLRDLRRKNGVARSWGIESELLSPPEARGLNPLLSDRILGAFYVPSDGIARAIRASEALAQDAQARGIEFRGGVEVNGFDVALGRIRGVRTSQGRIACETALIATGIWARRTGRLAGISLPVVPMQHQYAITGPLSDLAGETAEVRHPVMRHQDLSMYFRQERDAYGVGSYRHEPIPVDPETLASHTVDGRAPAIRDFVPELFEQPLECARELLPALRKVELAHAINGIFSFTPDGMPVLGESPHVRGLWVAAAVWITHAGGVGKTIAEWITSGEPEWDMRECDIARFHPHALEPAYVWARSSQQYREVYDIIHPKQQPTVARDIRASPFFEREVELGAHHGESGGWERPLWYEMNRSEAPGRPQLSGWEAVEWSPAIGTEHLAARERAAVFDMTPLTKIAVEGPGALGFLQRMTANQMDRPSGSASYTSMLTRSGRIRCDLTVIRRATDRFLVMTAGSTGARDLAWLAEQGRGRKDIQIVDVTTTMCCVGLWGPRARDVLASVCTDDLSNRGFPYLGVREIHVGDVPTMAVRISYVGELGWELYAPTEAGVELWDAVWKAGRQWDVVAAGTGAQDSMRLEKGYLLWGTDIHTDHNPYEAGLGFAVRLDKGEFNGRDALLRFRRDGVTRRLCCLTLDDPGAVVLGKEPIFVDGTPAGFVTSAGFGYSIGRCIAFGYLPIGSARPGTGVQIEYFCDRLPATVRKAPLFDPGNERLRS
jgi:glycine cleavage system aminomethyltransferase T/glycine/D-amino acid oxidase-like deaminating enzyme